MCVLLTMQVIHVIMLPFSLSASCRAFFGRIIRPMLACESAPLVQRDDLAHEHKKEYRLIW